jgi:hypothetical protein
MRRPRREVFWKGRSPYEFSSNVCVCHMIAKILAIIVPAPLFDQSDAVSRIRCALRHPF